MEKTLSTLGSISGFLWGWPTLILLVGTGIYLSFLLKGLQFKQLIPALGMAFSKQGRSSKGHGSISNFQALMTALSATVGTGNIVGVATAIAVGGPGAVFWMWVTGFLGMATKYTEAFLGVYYRTQNKNGGFSGGPMHYIEHGLGLKWLAGIFAFCLVFAAFGIGNMLQSNSIADALASNFGLSPLITAAVVTLATGLVILGGIQRIGQVAAAVVPIMILLYISVGSAIIISHIHLIPEIFILIVTDAFTGTAAAGGFAGAGVKLAMQQGFSRGVFSSESGLGTAPIAAAAARTKHPAEQALISMTQTFIDTIIVCSFTAFIILISGLWNASGRTGSHGAALTSEAFNVTLNLSVFGIELGGAVVAISLVFFAFTSILGWGYYGEKGMEYLLGKRSVLPFKLVYLLVAFLGAWLMYAIPNAKDAVSMAWSFAEIVTACMIFPNLIALILLAPQVKILTLDYLNAMRTNTSFHYSAFAKPSGGQPAQFKRTPMKR